MRARYHDWNQRDGNPRRHRHDSAERRDGARREGQRRHTGFRLGLLELRLPAAWHRVDHDRRRRFDSDVDRVRDECHRAQCNPPVVLGPARTCRTSPMARRAPTSNTTPQRRQAEAGKSTFAKNATSITITSANGSIFPGMSVSGGAAISSGTTVSNYDAATGVVTLSKGTSSAGTSVTITFGGTASAYYSEASGGWQCVPCDGVQGFQCCSVVCGPVSGPSVPSLGYTWGAGATVPKAAVACRQRLPGLRYRQRRCRYRVPEPRVP